MKRPVRNAIPQTLAGLLVAILVLATLWSNRDLIRPVAGYGLIGANGQVVPSATTDLAPGSTAPDFRLRTTGNDVIELADLRGQPVVLHFWNTWCLACLDNLPQVQMVADQWSERAAVVGIVPAESAYRVRETADRYQLAYDIALDANGSVASGYGADALPVVIVLDAEGTVVVIFEGPASAEEIGSALNDATAT